MATFPTSIPAYAGFTSSHTLVADSHAAQHNAEQGDITAIATKVGTGSSTPAAGKVLRSTGTGVSSWGPVGLTTDVTGVLPAANLPVTTLLANVYPVGSIYTETTGVNPGTTFGFGTWTAFGQGRVLVGNGSSDQAFAAGATGGESNHTLTSNEMPSHTHVQDAHGHNININDVISGSGFNAVARTTSVATQGLVQNTTATNQNTGGGASHNNLPPYLVVYFWQRTA